MELKNLITMPWEYNFEFECGSKDYMELDTFTRYFTYKVLGDKADSAYKPANEFIEEMNDKIKTNVYDPDGSGRNHVIVHEIYGALWDWKKANRTFGLIGEGTRLHFGGETMNSVQTALGWLVGKNPNNKYSMLWSLKEWRENPETFENFGIKDYIDAYHTLGNFVLVPAGFNRDRGMDPNLNDFWDLSLEYLKNNGYSGGYGSFPAEGKDFNWYINYFFLWDWVDRNDEGYTVNIFSPKNEDSEQEFKHFFDEIVKFIKRRGKFMTAMLMIQQEDPDLYGEIRKEFFDNSNLYGGFEDVIAKMFLHFEKENALSEHGYEHSAKQKLILDKLIKVGLIKHMSANEIVLVFENDLDGFEPIGTYGDHLLYVLHKKNER